VQKETEVLSLFNSIAHSYDLLNHVLSSGTDIFWRRKAVRILAPFSPRNILDVATGTGDFAIEAAKLSPERIVGLDNSAGMLEIAGKKIASRNLERTIILKQGKAEQIPFGEGSFDAVISAFGVRNFSDLERGLNEFFRVLRAGGMVLILEFSMPERFPFRQMYRFYSRHMLPLIGGLISKNRRAYKYLTESSLSFPYGSDFCGILASAGFKDISCRPLTFGVASIYTGIKSEAVG
jgi:demethylmenaquinone methyltransferase/2-methoxy-6-polyprenyl-1,4-benzoquinol methylase